MGRFSSPYVFFSSCIMNKFIFIFPISLCLLNAKTFSQQELDKAIYKFQYDLEFQYDTLRNNNVRNDIVILQVGDLISKSYSYYTFQADSLKGTPDGDKLARQYRKKAISKAMATGVKLEKLPFMKGISPFVYKNYPQGQMTVTDNIDRINYKYTDELQSYDWQISDSTKTILGYTCQMAVSDFRGRRWIAWFAQDIPISDGPWKFSGLPGLIMEVYDSEKHFHFVLVGIAEGLDEPIVFSPVVIDYQSFGEYEETTRLDFLKGLARYWGMNAAIMNAELGRETFDESGSNVRHNDFMERDYR